MFSFRPANFSPPAFAIEQQIPVQRLDYLLASQGGGTWRLMDGQVQKWGSTQTRKEFRAISLGQSAVVNAACEDAAWQFDCRHAAAPVFFGMSRTENTGKFPRDRDCHPRMSFLCAWITREIFGWAPTAGDWIASKEKFSTRRTGLHPWNVTIVVGGCARRFLGGLWRPGRNILANEFAPGLPRGPASGRLDSAGGSPATRLGGNPR